MKWSMASEDQSPGRLISFTRAPQQKTDVALPRRVYDLSYHIIIQLQFN